MHVERVANARGYDEFVSLASQASGPVGRGPVLPPTSAMVERVRRRLATETEPFWQHASRELFLLRDGRRAVGRIVAVSNRAYDAAQTDKAGFFGWFESPDDTEAARLLLDASSQWLRERGYQSIRGPLHIGLSEEIGALVEGFEPRPGLLAPWNSPALPKLFERVGLTKVHELHGYAWSRDEMPPPPASLRSENSGAGGRHVVYRPIEADRVELEVKRFLAAYNSALEYRWRFVPITEAEARARLHELRLYADLRLVWLAEVDGEPAGVVVAVPDMAPERPEAPFGALRAFRALRSALAASRIERVHLVSIAVAPRFGKLLVGAHLLLRVWRAALDLGVRYAELSGIDQDDENMHQLLWRLGCKRIRRYGIYEKPLI